MTDQKALDGALLKGAQTIEDAQSNIEATLAQIQSQLSSIGSVWQGEAASAVQAVMVEWDTEAKKVSGALTNLHSAMRSSDSAMQANESEQAASMNKYKNAYGAY